MSEQIESRTIVPMKGQSGELPRSDAWTYEIKWDGMRLIAYITADGVRLQSTNGRDVSTSFPELQSLRALGRTFNTVILDGEVVAFDGATPSFNALQHRMHVGDPAEAARRAKTTPVIFVAFDLLHIDGHDTMGLPLENRRTLLEQLDDDDACWTISEQHHDDIDGLISAVIESRLEGIVAKRLTSRYQAGRRSGDWIKYKPRLRQEFVVGGWLGGHGRRTGGLGSILVGVYDRGELHYAGRAGSGLSDTTRREWQDLLGEQVTCPFVEPPSLPYDRVVHWCAPEHVAEIAYHEWTPGNNLRHPVVLGRRSDKDPRHVVREL